MNRQLPILLVALLVLAGAAAWLLLGGDDPAAVGPVGPAGSGTAATRGVGDVREGAPLGRGGESGGIAEDLPADFLRDEVLAAGPDGPTWTLQCWDRQPGVPAAGVEVFVVDGLDVPELRDPFAPHWSDLAEEHGERLEADEQGLVELPPIQEWLIVAARGPGTWGFRRWGRDHAEFETLVLQADETLTVRVVDDEGRAVAGVPVGILQDVPERIEPQRVQAEIAQSTAMRARVQAWLEANPAQGERVQGRLRQVEAELQRAARRAAEMAETRRLAGYPDDWTEPFQVGKPELRARRRTDAAGLAEFRHFQLHPRGREDWWEPQYSDRFQATLMLPLQEPVAVAFRGRPVTDEVLELRMPGTGSVALRTVDMVGNPFTHPVRGELILVGVDGRPWSRVQIRKEQGQDCVEFPHVGLGLQLRADCRLDDDDFRWQVEPFAGPMRAGERVEIDVVVAPGVPMLRGRVLDAGGAPLADGEPTFLISSPLGRLEGEQVVLDQEGRFHLPYHVRGGHAAPFRLEVRHDRRRPLGGLLVDLDALPQTGITDVGDLQLGAFPVIAQGAVVDDLGAPIAGARLQLRQRIEVGEGENRRRTWTDVAFNQAETDADGRFALRGVLERDTDHLLRVTAPEHFEASTREIGGAEALTIVLQRRSRLLGTVLAPDWLRRQEIRVRLVSVDDPGQVREEQLRDYEGRTYIHFDNVRPGRYDLALLVRGFPDPFFEVRELEIRPGQMDRHPLLQDVDLGAWLFRFEIDAVDAAGNRFEPDRPLLARITRPGGRSGFIGFAWRNGRVEILSASPRLEVVATARRAVCEPTVLGTGRSTLRFLAIPSVELRTPGLRALVGELPVQLELSPVAGAVDGPDVLEAWDRDSRRLAGWYSGTRGGRADLGDDDVARTRLSASGRYRVVAQIGGRRGVAPETVELGECSIRLTPGGELPVVTLAVPAAAVQQAVLALAQRGASGGR